MVNKKFIDIAGLTRYNENLKTVLGKKQDSIEDLEAIRSGAAAGASALQSVPAEYVTEDELAGKGFATTAQVDAKQDIIEDLATIREGAAAGAVAEQNAKDYADGKFQVAGNYEEAGAAAQALADAKADAAEKYQVKGEYEAAGAADAALASAKEYADGLADNYDAAGAAAQALADAKADAASLYQVKGEYEAAGAADAALAAAKADAAEKYQVKGEYEAAGAAAQALADAKTYADGLNTAMDTRVKDLEAIDHEKLAADASAAAVATVLDGAPEKFDTLKEVAEWISSNESASSAADLVTRVAALEAIDHNAYVAADEVVLNSAKSYADGLASNYDEAGAAAQALADAKADAASLYQVKGNYETAGAAAQALVDAKAYTDGEVAKKQDIITDLATIREGAAAGATALQEADLQFATDGEIDALFA